MKMKIERKRSLRRASLKEKTFSRNLMIPMNDDYDRRRLIIDA